jgi:single-strand DNA-binding protein
MADMNRVFLVGNLTKPPEVRYTPSGRAVGDLRMAINRRFKSADGENREETCFVGVTVWDRQAETCAQYLTKGSPVLVEGRLKYDEWEKDGQKHNRLGVVAERVQFLSGPRSAEFKDGAAPRRAEPAAPPPPAPVGAPDAEPAQNAAEPAGDGDNLPF